MLAAMLGLMLVAGAPKVGESVTADSGVDGAPVVLLHSEVAYLRFNRGINAGDDDVLGELEDEGELTYLPNRVKVRILDFHGDESDLPRVHVRVLEGKAKGRKGWLVPDYVVTPD